MWFVGMGVKFMVLPPIVGSSIIVSSKLFSDIYSETFTVSLYSKISYYLESITSISLSFILAYLNYL